MSKFIWYPKCSTCQVAKKKLEELGFELELQDIKENKLSLEEITSIYKMSGLEIKKFFNTSGLKYKELGLKDKLATMSEQEKLELLASDGMLVKRPILVHNGSVVVGKKEAQYEGLVQ